MQAFFWNANVIYLSLFNDIPLYERLLWSSYEHFLKVEICPKQKVPPFKRMKSTQWSNGLIIPCFSHMELQFFY